MISSKQYERQDTKNGGGALSPRVSRRDDLVRAALDAFSEQGYEATSVSRLAARTGLSKAAFSYHFVSKDSLLIEIASPLLAALREVERRHRGMPGWPDGVRALLADYIDVLMDHAGVVTWIDGDKSVLNHPALGEELRRSNAFMRRALAGGRRTERSRVQAAAVLGMLWRPLRNLDLRNVVRARDSLLDLAVEAVGTVRGER